ncbi:MAG: hypothetical protein K0U52_01445, partial [Gammaproteobacteria bacterium]|nr:hypothetical protein [Gammaproteobacteria bacterium]
MGSTQSKNYRLDKILDKYNLVENFETRACNSVEARAHQCCGITTGRLVDRNCTDDNPSLCPSETPPGMSSDLGKLCCIGLNCNNGSIDASNPCTCKCDPGWTGTYCTEQAEVPCDRGPDGNDNPICSGHGTANTSRTRDPNGDYSSCACNCMATFAGSYCQYSDRDTCSGHGTVSVDAQDNHRCACDQGYEGGDCSQAVACTNGPNDQPCRNGGTPTGNLIDGCTCDCSNAPNYEGEHCETPIPCVATGDTQAPEYIDCNNAADPARNVATGNLIVGCSCSCSSDYTGNHCQHHRSDTCNNHGTPDAAGTCSCDPGWETPPGAAAGDAQCTQAVCQGTHSGGDNYIECQHGGTIETPSPPCSCRCTQGWQGDRCDVAQDQSCNSVDLGDGNPVPIGWNAAAGTAVRCL